MHKLFLLIGMIGAMPAMAAQKPAEIMPGVYTNEEQVYFDKEAKRAAPPWLSVAVTRDAGGLRATAIDAFGKALPDAIDVAALSPSKSAGRINYRFAGGQITELRRSREVSCWVAIRKDAPKPDGSEDWMFTRGVKLHDQGGRARVGGADGAQPVIVRVRNVTWDVGSTNNPVLTLYIHKPENPDRAESYSWAAPDSQRIGINLRWVQSGCSLEGAAPQSKLTNKNVKG